MIQMHNTPAEVQKAYDTWVHQYDTNENPTRDLNARVLRQQPFALAGKSVMEIGCGTGINTIWLAEHAQSVVGVDIAEGMLKKARSRLGEEKACMLQADITKPWSFDLAFDLVVANLVLEHVRDLSHVFNEAHHILLPKGLFYIGELHPYKQLRGAQAKYRDTETDQDVLVPAFTHHVSEYINEGIKAGFTLCRIGEWQNEMDTDFRLLTLLFERA
ncbi:class I SAM-dependent methyltransferase [Aidingimonas lacisalsi]|uniref:class I SAM-dependent methyltransferase n=1 Tax=Aidingimonas lacisalsi TaxID=2604086 RepID=UPI0011D21243|nr:class I SAM-dependent methyltransferase [Aidingimonas lacisalsi]